MNDMTAVIVPKSDQINADDLIAGPLTFTIQGVAITAGTEQPVSIDIGLAGKVYRPCKSMSRVLVAAWGPDAKAYTGRSMTLYRDPTVKWGGMDVGGIRISHLSDIPREMTMALTATRQTRKPFTVKPLGPAPAPETGRTVPRTSFVTKWAATWRERFGEATDGGELKAAWESADNARAKDRVFKEDHAVLDAVTGEYEARCEELVETA